ncbi:MAG: hypothetical protein PWP70_1450 [Moorella sp. (in: firmicutes)]|nr:hypothetical protein [Moorella sp. (in: firmicutes)]
METWAAIKGRRTVHMYRPDPVEEEILQKIFAAGTWAPSHANKQPWEFIRIGPRTREKLIPLLQERLENGPLKRPDLPADRKNMLRRFGENIGNVPELIAVVTCPGSNPMEDFEFPLAAAAAIQNMALMAYDLGLASIWLSLGLHPRARGILGVPEDYKIVGILGLGYPEYTPEAPPRLALQAKLRQLP